MDGIGTFFLKLLDNRQAILPIAVLLFYFSLLMMCLYRKTDSYAARKIRKDLEK